MKGLDGKSGVTAGVTGVTEPDALQRGQSMHDLTDGAVDLIGDFLNDEGGVGHIGAAQRRLLAQRQRRSVEMAERERRLARPKKDDARMNVADSHVERIVVDEGKLRFGFGIEKLIDKGAMPHAALAACARFRSAVEMASAGGACAIVDPSKVRVDASRRATTFPDGALGSDLDLRAALDACGGPKSPVAMVLIRCVGEGKTIKAATGEITMTKLGADKDFTRGLLVAGVYCLIKHYGY